jgi:hypothetical protein
VGGFFVFSIRVSASTDIANSPGAMPPDTPPAPSSANPSPIEFRFEEFRQLRATIRERSVARVVVSLITFVSWAALVLALRQSRESVVDGLVPLVVLVVGFELVFGLHVGVERIGRYLTVFYEAAPGMPKWETAIAAFGRSAVRSRTQPHVLLATEFIVSTGLNLVFAGWPDMTALAQSIAMAVFHVTFIARVVQAARQANRQRDADTEAFRAVAHDLGA